jgi:hypothetical protein
MNRVPAPAAGQPYFNMFRWGAQTNLGRLNEAKGDLARATAFYSGFDKTTQHHGNLLRARDLIWQDPTLPAATLPPPPAPTEPPSPPPAPPQAAGPLQPGMPAPNQVPRRAPAAGPIAPAPGLGQSAGIPGLEPGR